MAYFELGGELRSHMSWSIFLLETYIILIYYVLILEGSMTPSSSESMYITFFSLRKRVELIPCIVKNRNKTKERVELFVCDRK